MNKKSLDHFEKQLICFARDLVRIQSYSGEEDELAKFISETMTSLNYDSVRIDEMGNVIGRVGTPDAPCILLDSHMDTVAVNDSDQWTYPPFEGLIRDHKLFGRGASDMKSSIAAAVFAAAKARSTLLKDGRSVHVTCTVCEETCDGEALRYILENENLNPEYVVICEPSNNQIMLGHNGKAQIQINVHGVSAHGSSPSLGINAIYKMSPILSRVEELADSLDAKRNSGSITLVEIKSTTASSNSVPDSCLLRLDRRLAVHEDESTILKELKYLLGETQASWSYDIVHMKTWRGHKIFYQPLHFAWRISEDHPAIKKCTAVFREVFENREPQYGHWNFSTNAVAPVALGIPTLGFGPGDPSVIHAADEYCRIDNMIDAFRFYHSLVNKS